jgi:uncharacterized protein with ParB-like and HNH nuclease domain
MDARVKTVREILHSGDQYIVPFFQRFYSWDHEHWKRLLDDLMSLVDSPGDGMHFLGPLVCTPAQHVPGEVTAYQLIDGQQRLTTLTLVLISLRDLCRENNLADLAEEIHEDFLVHKRRSDLQHYKIVPRIGDREALIAILDGKEFTEFKDFRLLKGLRFFAKELRKYVDSDPQAQLPSLFRALTAQMSLVVITVAGENPYEIFESLNSTGLPLEQSDLIRNYVFMEVALPNQEAFFREHWAGYESAFEARDEFAAMDVTSFYRNYLMRTGAYSKRNEIYIDFKTQNRERELEPATQVAELSRFARFQSWLDRPSTCKQQSLRQWLWEISLLDITTAHPLLLALLDRWEMKSLTTEDLGQCIQDLSSFVLRRSITGESTRPYGRWFPEATKVIASDPVNDLRNYWSSRGWPTDTQFVRAMVEFQLYRRERSKCRLILDRLEASYGHKERVDPSALTIEHVMPQTVGDDEYGKSWQEVLGPGWYELHQQWVHTIGNLTLTGYNPDMSNRGYQSKRLWLIDSNLVLNSHFKSSESWSVDEIRTRGKRLATEIAALWPNPIASIENSGDVASNRNSNRIDFDIEGLRALSIQRLETKLGYDLIREGEAKFLGRDGSHFVLCIASKPYERDGALGYWFGVTPEQMDFLSESRLAHIALCCGSPDRVLWMTSNEFRPLTQCMNETKGKHWHVQVFWGDKVLLDQPKSESKRKVDVSRFLLH